MYDPELDAWEELAPMPMARGGIDGAAYGGRLFVFGSEEVSVETFDEVAAHDPSTDRWVTLPAMPTGRFGPGTAAIGDTIYVAAGGPAPGPGSFSGILEILELGAG